MRTAFEYLCLDCLFGRSHSCSCSCWSDSLHCCLLETSSFHSRRWLFFFFLRRLDLLCWFNISIIWERNGICYWFEDQRRKMDGWNHKEGWWAGGERAFSCCRGTWGRWAQQGHCGNLHIRMKKNRNFTFAQLIAQSHHLPFSRQSQKHQEDASCRNESTAARAFLPFWLELMMLSSLTSVRKNLELLPERCQLSSFSLCVNWKTPTFVAAQVCYDSPQQSWERWDEEILLTVPLNEGFNLTHNT